MKSNSNRYFTIGVCLWVCFSTARVLGEYTSVSIHYDRNGDARTRLGSIDGPLAGEEIWAQAFAGFTPTSLQPVDNSVPHLPDLGIKQLEGYFNLGITIIPDIPLDTPGFVQVAAWDSSVWGRDFRQVPETQFGYSEVAPFRAYRGAPNPPSLVLLTKSIIVPTIPEPETWALLAMGGLLMGTVYLRKR